MAQYIKDADGNLTLVDPCTRQLADIQAEKVAALVADPTLDIDPCSGTPLPTNAGDSE